MFGIDKFGEGIGLGRIMRFMDEHQFDRADLATRSIVVTGSNGKGSTASLLSAALGHGARRVGLFTSPHLYSVRERFRIGGELIAQKDYDAYAQIALDFRGRQPEGDRPGAFEILFMIALLWFRDQRPDVMVWEAGLGGRYDPVRTLRSKLSILTGLELEHTELLGSTEELIACEKIDALAHGGTVIVSGSVSRRYRPRIEAFCRITDRHPVFVDDDYLAEDAVLSKDGTTIGFTSSGNPDSALQITLPLVGAHQAQNALAALRALQEYLRLSNERSRLQPYIEAMKATRWPGRLERFRGPPDLWIDVGHTPGAIEAVSAAYLSLAPPEQTLVIFGASSAKKVEEMAHICASNFPRVILTRPSKGGAEIERFRDFFSECDTTAIASTRQAADVARSLAEREGLNVLALGGLFLAAEIQHAWFGGDPADLDFL